MHHHSGHKYVQAEDNSFQPILPESDIAQMYHRILDTEIAVITGDQPQVKHASANSSGQNLRLAASMGLSQLMMPFRYAARTGLVCCHVQTESLTSSLETLLHTI